MDIQEQRVRFVVAASRRDRFLCRSLGWLGRFHLQPELLGVEEFTDFVDQLAEAGWVCLFCGKAAEMHPVFFGLALHGASSISYLYRLVFGRRWCPPVSVVVSGRVATSARARIRGSGECALAYRQTCDHQLRYLQTLRLQAPA